MHRSLTDWLDLQLNGHSQVIELGLERVAQVWEKLWPHAIPARVITVAGTNGKGSTVAMLEAILRAGHYRVGVYTSPHLFSYNERIKIDGELIDDDALCRLFTEIEQARGNIALTYFEYGTLAALLYFVQQRVDVMVLEVGLGGRLDAVNIIDADMAIISSIDIDHQAYLGDNREAIGFEKAGIMRPGGLAVYGDRYPVQSVVEQAQNLSAHLNVFARDFDYSEEEHCWNWRGPARCIKGLPKPALRGRCQFNNAAQVIMALEMLAEYLPVTDDALCQGLTEVKLPGRMQIVSMGALEYVFDVAHNQQAVKELAVNIAGLAVKDKTWAICGMLADKCIQSTVEALKDRVDYWLFTGLKEARSFTTQQLREQVKNLAFDLNYQIMEQSDGAVRHIKSAARAGERVLVFGSFYTVAEVYPQVCMKE